MTGPRPSIGLVKRFRDWAGRCARSALTWLRDRHLWPAGVPRLAVFSELTDGESLVEFVDVPPSVEDGLEGSDPPSKQRLRCQVVWRGEPLDTSSEVDDCTWIDAPRAASMALEAGPNRPWPEGKPWMLLVVIVGPEATEAHLVRGPGARPRPFEVRSNAVALDDPTVSLAKVVRSALGRRKSLCPALLVAGPGLTDQRMARFHDEASALGHPRFEPRDVLLEYAKAWAARLESGSVESSLEDDPTWRVDVRRSLWGAVARGSLVVPRTPSRASWTLELEGMGLSGGHLDLNLSTSGGGLIERSPGQAGTREFVFQVPPSPVDLIEPIEAEVDFCPATGSARLRGSWSRRRHRCEPGRLANPSTLRAGGCRRCGADFPVDWPGLAAKPRPTREPRRVALSVLIAVGAGLPDPAFVRRTRALLDSLDHSGRAPSLAFERSGPSRQVWFSDESGHSADDLLAMLGRAAADRATPTIGLEETLGLTLSRVPAADGGVFLLIIADRHADLGPDSLLGSEPGAWAWLLNARRGLRRPIHLAACAEPREPCRQGLTLALESLVLRGAQASHRENLVHWWNPVLDPESAGREDADALLSVVDACESRDRDANLLRVVSSRSRHP